jgi:hypothetical protein
LSVVNGIEAKPLGDDPRKPFGGDDNGNDELDFLVRLKNFPINKR